MTYQEQKRLTMGAVLIMATLVFIYISLVVIGLINLSKDFEIKTSQTHNPKSVTLQHKSVEGLTPPTQPEVISPDTYLLAHIINAEAGNQPYEGKIAVGNVVMNRVAHPQFPKTVEDVIYQKGQFSPVSNGSIHKEPNADSIQAAKDVMNGSRVVGEDVIFFYEPNLSTDSWIFSREVVTTIGDHVFAI